MLTWRDVLQAVLFGVLAAVLAFAVQNGEGRSTGKQAAASARTTVAACLT